MLHAKKFTSTRLTSEFYCGLPHVDQQTPHFVHILLSDILVPSERGNRSAVEIRGEGQEANPHILHNKLILETHPRF
jgi:hypothetical protein